MELLFEFSILWLTMFFMIVGLIGIAVPFFPGLLIVWLAALGYGVATGIESFGIVALVLITIAMIFGSVTDNIFSGAGARGGGASWIAIGAGIVAGVIGTLIFPPFGGFITAPLGLLGAEILRNRDLGKAFQAMRGWAVGCGWAYVLRLLTGILMIEIWVIWVLWG